MDLKLFKRDISLYRSNTVSSSRGDRWTQRCTWNISIQKTLHHTFSTFIRSHFIITMICMQKRRRSNVVGKFREFSDSVWVGFGAVIIEKTLKEDWTNKNNFYDNYNLVYSDTMIITTTFAHSVAFVLTYLLCVLVECIFQDVWKDAT